MFHSALEFIESGLEPPTYILSASSICLASGVVKVDRIIILKSGAVLGCWDSMWDTIGLALTLFLRSFRCSSHCRKHYVQFAPGTHQREQVCCRCYS